MDSITQDYLRSYRFWKNRLIRANVYNDIFDVIHDTVAFPASNSMGLYIGLFNRMKNISKQTIEKILNNNLELGRFRGMRRDTFLIHKDNFEMIFSGTHRMREERIKKDLQIWGIEKPEYINIARKILNNLSSCKLNYLSLQKSLPEEDVRQIKLKEGKSSISSTNFEQVFSVLLDRWQVIRSWEKPGSKHPVYCLFDALHSPSMFSNDYAKAENTLVLRYIGSFGPVTVEEIAWWCDLASLRVKQILELPEIKSEIEEIEITGSTHYIDINELEDFNEQEYEIEDQCHILGENDPLLLGYPFEEIFVAPEYRASVFNRSGGSQPSVMIDGRVIGTWSFKETKSCLDLSISMFRSIKRKQESRLFRETDRIADFLCEKDKTTNVEIVYR